MTVLRAAAPALSLVVLSALTVTHPGLALAGPMPDHVQLVLMRRSVEEVPLVRMRGSFGTRQGYRPLLDSSGVRMVQLEGKHGAMRTDAMSSSEIEPIAWDQISSMETDRGSAAGGVLIGGLIGIAVAAGIGLSSIDHTSLRDQSHDHDGAMLVAIGGGVALGYLIGRHGQRRAIYPPGEAR